MERATDQESIDRRLRRLRRAMEENAEAGRAAQALLDTMLALQGQTARSEDGR